MNVNDFHEQTMDVDVSSDSCSSSFPSSSFNESVSPSSSFSSILCMNTSYLLYIIGLLNNEEEKEKLANCNWSSFSTFNEGSTSKFDLFFPFKATVDDKFLGKLVAIIIFSNII